MLSDRLQTERFQAHPILALAGLAALCAAHPGLAANAASEVRLRQSGTSVLATRGGVELAFDPAGKGFVAATKCGGHVVGKANESSGLFASLLVPQQHVLPLQPIAGSEVQAAVDVGSVRGDENPDGTAEVHIKGTARFEELGNARFVVTVKVPIGGPAMAVSAELRLPEEVPGAHLSSFGIAVPLDLAVHPSSRMNSKVDHERVAAAILPRYGTPVPEVRWLVAEQDDTSVWGPMLWTLAGVRQVTPTSFEVWEAWSPINPPFVLQYHNVHPGWMAVADGNVAVAAAMSGIEAVAPKEIFVDSRAKVLRICFQSPHCRPVDLAEAQGEVSAGPAYVFIHPAEPNTRKAQDYVREETRPALARIGEVVRELPPTQCSLPAMTVVDPAKRRDPPPMLEDPDFLSHVSGPPDEIPIWVDDPNGVELGGFPIARGVPIAQGVLKDHRQAALLDARDRPVPCVTRALAFWPDGSVKWLLVEFQARLSGAGNTRFTLVLGEKARPAPVSGGLRVGESTDGVLVDTGRLKATLDGADGKLRLGIGLDQNTDGRVDDAETIISKATGMLGCLFTHVDDSSKQLSHTWLNHGRPDPGIAQIKEIRVEERSPFRAVILVRADLKHKLLASTIRQEHRPDCGTPVTLRLHFYAGSSLVRVQHTFMFAGDVNHDFLRQLGVCLPLAVAPGQAVRTSVDGVQVERERNGQLGLLQEGPDSGFVWQADGTRTRALARGRVCDGWLDVCGPRWGVTVGLRRMREMFPQEIHVDRRGIWTHFHSPRVVPMDVRRYAFKYGGGESTSTGFGTAFGAMRTHEAYWCFHSRGEQHDALKQIRSMLHPPLARIRPRYVADTRAVGHVAELGAPHNDPHFDSVLLHMPRMHQHNRVFWRWYGFWDFGDEIQVYSAHRHRWAKDDGRYGWYNNEPIRDYNYHLAYLMTGNRRVWEQAEAMAYHVFEVDLRHAKPQPFMGAGASLKRQLYDHSTTDGIDLRGRRHNCQHWADGYWGARVGSPPGFRLCYYQTGDPVMREYLMRLLATASQTRRSRYMHADGDEAVLWAMIMGYEMTLDEAYLDRIRAYLKLQADFAKEHNGIPAGQANWDWSTNKPGAPAENPAEDLWVWSFGGHVGMIEAAEILNEPEIDRFLQNWLLALEGQGSDNRRRERWATNMAISPLLAYYYRRTGDRRAVEWFERRARSFHSQVPEEAPNADLPLSVMETTLPAYTPNDGYGWVYSTSTFWYVGIPAWQGALRRHAGSR